MERCYISLEGIYVIHITILQLYKELIVLNFLLFGKEYAQIYFPFLNYVCRLEFDRIKNHSDNATTSSDDEIQGVSLLPSCKFYSLVHAHGAHEFFIKVFHQKQFIQVIEMNINTYWRDISNVVPCPFLREDFPHVGFHLSSLFWTWIIVRVTIALLLGSIYTYIFDRNIINSKLNGVWEYNKPTS